MFYFIIVEQQLNKNKQLSKMFFCSFSDKNIISYYIISFITINNNYYYNYKPIAIIYKHSIVNLKIPVRTSPRVGLLPF